MGDTAEIVRVLGRAALFKNFTETGLKIIASICHPKQIPADAPLFVENMIGDGLYIIAEGEVRLSLRREGGGETVLTTLSTGESIGEAALLRVGPRLCSATAVVDTKVLEISRRDLAMLQRSKPQACIKLMMGVVERIGEGVHAAQDDLRQIVSR